MKLKQKIIIVLLCSITIICNWYNFIVTENKLYAQAPPTDIYSNGTPISYVHISNTINGGVIIANNHYWYTGGDAPIPTTEYYFGLSGFNDLSDNSGTPVVGIFSDFNELALDLAGNTVTVLNDYNVTSTPPLQYVAAGFGYASNNHFAGTIAISPSATVLGNFTAASDKGAAYGMIFANANMNGISNLGVDTWIDVGTLTATTNSVGDVAVGFQAFDVMADDSTRAVVSINEIKTFHNGTGGSSVGILLGNISGAVVGELNSQAGINITGHIQDAGTVASGLHATEISEGAIVKLGTININSDGNDEGNLYGVQINQVGSGGVPGSSTSTTIGRIAGELEVGNINLGTTNAAKEAVGFLLKNDNGIFNSFAPGITETGQVTLSDITVNSDSSFAVGVSLGSYDPSYDSSTNIDFGYAASGKLILNGDIKVTSNSSDAVGIFAGQLAELNVNVTIDAENNGTNGYGIKTIGKTESDGTNNKASVINIGDGGVIKGSAISISLGAKEGDQVKLTSENWTNDNAAFTMDGVETLNVTANASLEAGSKRGTATTISNETLTNITNGKKLTVFNTFFDEGNQIIKGGSLEIKNDAGGITGIDGLTFDGVDVTFEAGAQLVFQDDLTDRKVNIINNSTVTFNRAGTDISGFATQEWKALPTGDSWTDYPIQISINNNSTLKFAGDLDNNDAAWYLHPFETIIGEGGAKIDVVGNMKVEVGEVKAANTNISITKTGSGELKLIDDFDLGTNGLIKLEAGVLAVGHGTNYNPTITNGEIIHSSPSLQMSNSSKFVLDNRDATLNQLLGSANTEVSLSSNQLKVNSGTFSGKINGLANSQIVKDGSGYLTINGNNSEMAGALVQNSGTVELQSNWGDNNHAGRIEQNNGRFIFNGGDNSSPTRVFGDAKFNGAGIVEIHSNVIAKSFEVGAGTDLVIDVTPLNRDWSDLITVDNSFNADTKIKLQEAAEAAGLLYSRTGTFDNNDTSFSIQYDTITLSDYAIKEGMTRNIGRVGSLIDDLMAKSPDFAKIIYDFDRDDVNILLTEFLGAELAANARFLAFHNPQYRVFDHLRSLDRSTPSGILGQSGFRILSLDYDLWFEGNFRSEQVKGDGDSWGYDVDRGGIFVGLDAKFGDRITSGLMFSYGNPHISNRIGKITADDISFGIYSRFKVFWECSINVFLGYGVQNYKYNNAGNTTDYNGDSLYASMEISRPLPFYAYGQLIPIFAIDFQKAWSDAFAEGNPNNFGLTIGKSDIDQAILRFGLNSKITPTRRFHLRTKLQYGLQVAGDLYASAPTSFTMNPTITQNFRSVKRGRNNLNIGIGTDIYTIDEQTKFFIDYDYIYNKKSDTHALQLGIITTR